MIIQTNEELIKEIERHSPDTVYEWSASFPKAAKADASEVAQYLNGWADSNGGKIVTAHLASDADRAGSPLYPLVTHDMEVAAHQWRLHEVRGICNALRVVVVQEAQDAEPTTVYVSAFPNVSEDGQRAYTPIRVVARSEDLALEYAESIKAELFRLSKKAREFGLFAEVVQAIESLNDAD